MNDAVDPQASIFPWAFICVSFPQYLGSMLVKELRGTESTQDACAKMRVNHSPSHFISAALSKEPRTIINIFCWFLRAQWRAQTVRHLLHSITFLWNWDTVPECPHTHYNVNKFKISWLWIKCIEGFILNVPPRVAQLTPPPKSSLRLTSFPSLLFLTLSCIFLMLTHLPHILL